jgi:hypothetical protein
VAIGASNVISANLDTAGFVPEIWQDEIMAAHKRSHVLAGLVRKIGVKGKKGNVVNLPAPTRGTASSKAVNTSVNTIVAGGTGITIPLDQHWEYSRLIEDIAETHALASMRRFYTDDAGYALAKAKDDYLFVSARKLAGNAGAAVSGATGAWSGASIAGDGITAFVDATGNANATAITDAGIRRAIQSLDEANFPMSDRFLVVPPVARRVMMGLARFTEQAFVGDGKVIRNGKLGDVYGVSVHVSSNCPTPSKGTTVRIGLLAHETALVLCDVLGPRVQQQYKQEFLGTLLTADTIFGASSAYASGGVALAMPA